MDDIFLKMMNYLKRRDEISSKEEMDVARRLRLLLTDLPFLLARMDTGIPLL